MNKEFSNFIRLKGTEKLNELSDNTPYLIFSEVFSSNYPTALYKHLTSKGVVITRCLLNNEYENGYSFVDENFDFVIEQLLINQEFIKELEEIVTNNEYLRDEINYKKGNNVLEYDLNRFLNFLVTSYDSIFSENKFQEFTSKYYKTDTEELKKYRLTL